MSADKKTNGDGKMSHRQKTDYCKAHIDKMNKTIQTSILQRVLLDLQDAGVDAKTAIIPNTDSIGVSIDLDKLQKASSSTLDKIYNIIYSRFCELERGPPDDDVDESVEVEAATDASAIVTKPSTPPEAKKMSPKRSPIAKSASDTKPATKPATKSATGTKAAAKPATKKASTK